MNEQSVCIKEKKPLELTLNDCLSCSGCVTENEKSFLLESHLEKVKSLDKEKKCFVISPFSLLHIFDFYKNGTFSEFQNEISKFLTNFCDSSTINTSYYLKGILESTEKEFNKKSKLITSDCPGVVKYIERNGHHLLPYLSSTFSPQEVAVNQLTNDIIISVIPCLDKKLEKCNINYYLTTYEFYEYLIYKGFNFVNSLFDNSFNNNSFISYFNNSFSGGYTEYLIKCIDEEFTIKEEKKGYFVYQSKNKRFLKIYGLRNLLNFINRTKKGLDFDFVELFLCENGCVGSPLKYNLKNVYDIMNYNDVTYNEDINYYGKVFKVEKSRKVRFNVEW